MVVNREANEADRLTEAYRAGLSGGSRATAARVAEAATTAAADATAEFRNNIGPPGTGRAPQPYSGVAGTPANAEPSLLLTGEARSQYNVARQRQPYAFSVAAAVAAGGEASACGASSSHQQAPAPPVVPPSQQQHQPAPEEFQGLPAPREANDEECYAVVGRGFGNHRTGIEVAKPGIYIGSRVLRRHFLDGADWGRIPRGSVVKHDRILEAVRHWERIHRRSFQAPLIFA